MFVILQKISYNYHEYNVCSLFWYLMKNKKPLFIAIIALDLALTIFFLVISIIMLASTVGKTPAELAANTGFIGYLQNHTTFYGLVFVVPLFLLLAGNIIGLVIYVKKTSKSEPTQLNDLSEEQKEALRQELLKDLMGGTAPKEEPKAPEAPAEEKVEESKE